MLSFCSSFFIFSSLFLNLPKQNEKGSDYPNRAVAARPAAGFTLAIQMSATATALRAWCRGGSSAASGPAGEL